MAKAKQGRMSGLKIAAIVLAAIVLALGVTALILGLIKADSGVAFSDTGAAQVRYFQVGDMYYKDQKTSDKVENLSREDSAADFNTFSDNYKKMTSFTVLRGVLEGKGSPKAKVNDKIVGAKAATAVKAVRSDEETYIVTVRYNELQTSTFDNTDSDEDAMTATFNTLVFSVADTNILKEIKVYAFNDDVYDKDNNDYLECWELVITGNQKRLYQNCKDMFLFSA